MTNSIVLRIALPEELITARTIALATGLLAQVATVQSDNTGACGNCGDAGLVYLRTGRGPQRFPPTGIKEPIFSTPDGWYIGRLGAYPCPVCNAGGREQQIAALWELSGLNDDEREWRLDYLAGDAGKTDALTAARAVLSESHGWLFLYGDYGMGKTGILKSIVAASVRAVRMARYVTAAEILSEIRATYNDNNDETERKIIARYARYPVLAIDELGLDRVSGTQWALSVLFNLVDKRYTERNRLVTLLASNDAPERLAGTSLAYFESRTRDGLRVRVAGHGLRGK